MVGSREPLDLEAWAASWAYFLVFSFGTLSALVIGYFELWGEMAAQTPEQVLLDMQAQLQVHQDMLIQQQTQMQQVMARLTESNTRAERAEEERYLAMKLLSQRQGAEDLVDTKGVGQPFKFSGKTDQDFAEWDHKMKTFLRAKYGPELDPVFAWVLKQRKVVMRFADASNRTVGWDEAFGSTADTLDSIEGFEKMVNGIYAYLVSFTTGEANKVVRNSGTDGLEAWRRIHNEYDPTSSMRRVVHGAEPSEVRERRQVGRGIGRLVGQEETV